MPTISAPLRKRLSSGGGVYPAWIISLMERGHPVRQARASALLP